MKKLSDTLNKIKSWKTRHVIFACAVILMLCTILGAHTYKYVPTPINIPYNIFVKMEKMGQIKTVRIDFGASKFDFEGKDGKIYNTDNPRYLGFKESMLTAGLDVVETSTMNFGLIFTALFDIILFYVLIKYISPNRMGKMLGRSNLVVPKTRLKDIAGIDDIKDEVKYLVSALKNPSKFAEMGAELPKGIVLYGPPGTGKTLTARAIAGEAGVPFFSMGGSDFVELFVGFGARKVRNLFKEAKKKAPCIIFIDELDAVGASRGVGGSHAESNQTIGALLQELDGFDGSTGIIVIGATNLMEKLDPALIRPGRFDKHLMVGLPESADRLSILKTYTEGKTFDESVNFDDLARLTIGFSGAALKVLLNESAILAVSRDKSAIGKEEVDDAFFKIVMKGSKKKRPSENKELVAWHEAGHALCSKLISTNEITKISIVPATNGAEGVTFITPKKMGLLSKSELTNDVKTLLAGRAAERLLFGNDNDITTGASMDISMATRIIQKMICEYGMSDKFGLLNLSELGVDNRVILEEASIISNLLYTQTLNLLSENIITLKSIVEALMEKESLTESELDAIINNNRTVV